MNRLVIRSFTLPALTVLVITGLAAADGFIVVHDPPPIRPPHPAPPRHLFAPLHVRDHHVTVTVTDQVAVTEIDQTFYNPHSRQLEGTYMFPVPVGAEIDRFTMDINGQPVEAELLDADKARRIYEDIVRKALDPALLEYAGQGVFKARVFPIEPHGEKRIRLKYTEILTRDGGLTRYLYPLNTEKFSAAPLDSVSIKLTLECSSPIRTLYSPSHPIEVRRDGGRRAVVGYEARNVRPDIDFELFYAPDNAQDVGLSLLTYHDGRDAEGGYFMLLASPSADLGRQSIADKDIVFVLDTSGSMSERNKIDQARRALQFCLRNLNEGDRFQIVRFATEAESVFDGLVPADAAHLDEANAFIERLKPIGGTAIEEALLRAVDSVGAPNDASRPCFIVFLTDGLPTVGTTDEEGIVSAVTGALENRSVRVFCFGIGTNVNTHLLDRLAERTQAVSQYVLPDEDIEIKVSSFYTKISSPVLADPRLDVSGDIRIAKQHPGRLPDLFKGEQAVVFGRYTGSGPATVILEGTVNGRSCRFEYPADFVSCAEQYEFVPRLWATRRVGHLLDQIRLHGESGELRDEVTALARRYGIVTPYTAYLIVEDEGRRNVPHHSRTLQPLDQGPVRSEVDRIYREANSVRSGETAVADSQAINALRDAQAVSAPREANDLTARGQRAAGYAGGQLVQQVIESQQARNVRGRTFFQNGEQWIDAAIQSVPGARRVQVRFGSDEYFDLVKRHRDAAQWLAVGRNVQVVLDGTVYEVIE